MYETYSAVSFSMELISVPDIKPVSVYYFIKQGLKNLGFLSKRDDTNFPALVAV
jgi:hypothetical protein